MALQILPPDSVIEAKSSFDFELLFVILSLALIVFLIIKASKYLSSIKEFKKVKVPNFSSFLVIFFLR